MNSDFTEFILDYGSCVNPLNPPYFQYEINSELQELVSQSTEGTLYLAYLYSAVSTNFRDSLTQQTGIETALELLRSCNQNSPYSDNEVRILSSIMSLQGKIKP